MRGYFGCPFINSGQGACDLDGPREYLCEHCLTALVRSERPEGWSPVVKKDKETASAQANPSLDNVKDKPS